MKQLKLSALTALLTLVQSVAFAQPAIFDDSYTLPVSWGSVDVNRQADGALVKWTTLSEENTQHYFVQHSTNGRDWTTVGTLPAANQPSSYQFLHNHPANGLNYYQILQLGADGRPNISKIVTVLWSSKVNFRIYPNPVSTGTIHVDSKITGTLQFVSSTGVLVKQVQVTVGVNKIDVSNLAKGIYVIKAGDESSTLIVK